MTDTLQVPGPEGGHQPPVAAIKAVDTLGIEKTGEAVYSYVFQVTWNDNRTSVVKHPYESLFKFQCELLDTFPIDAGTAGSPRTIPPLPGKKMFGLTISKAGKEAAAKSLAEKRLPGIVSYIGKLIKMPEHITQSALVYALFDADAASSPAQFRRRMSSVSAAAQQAAPHEVIDDPLAIKSGYLTKLGAHVKSWKRRWFVLSAMGKLLYYKAARTAGSSMAPQGSVRLAEVTCVPDASGVGCQWPDGVPSDRCFGVVSKNRTYCLYAETAEEAAEWRKALVDALPQKDPTDEGHRKPSRKGSASSIGSGSKVHHTFCAGLVCDGRPLACIVTRVAALRALSRGLQPFPAVGHIMYTRSVCTHSSPARTTSRDTGFCFDHGLL
eukprot:m.196330 g.196330  ORF g.196330 m.196330 type:complete len:382 (+) comp18323_c0_seq3:71-1216(+)